MNLAIKARLVEARLLRAVGELYEGGFSAWARAHLIREALKEAKRTGLQTLVNPSAFPHLRTTRGGKRV